MTEVNQNITIWQSEDLNSTVTVYNADGSVKNLTGMQEATWKIFDSDNTVILTHTYTGAEISIQDAAQGQLLLAVEAAVTGTWSPKIYRHQLHVLDNADVDEVILEGFLDVRYKR